MNCPAGAREAGLGHAPAAPFYRVSPCGASFFPSDGKETKGSPGDAADGHFVPIGPPPYPLCRFATSPPDRGSRPPVPHYGSYSLSQAESFRPAKSEWRSQFPPGHWALGLQKFSLLRLQFRALLGRAGGSWCCAVGRGLLDAPHTSAGRPVSGPYERTGCFRIRSRGGCPHPPALEGFSLCRARPPGRAVLNRRRETP